MRTPGLAERDQCHGCGASCGCESAIAPVLVLAIGNPLMADDGAGQEVLAKLESIAAGWGSQVELLDGGTQGLALLGQFEGREAVVFLDAVRLGEAAGSVHVLRGQEVLRMGGHATSAHEGSAPDILRALELLGETPAEVALVGVEPERIQIGIGLSPAVRGSLERAADSAKAAVDRILSAL